MFQLRVVDSRTWPFIRGIDILNAFCQDSDQLQRINRVFVIPGTATMSTTLYNCCIADLCNLGHIFVLFNDCTSLCSFDAVVSDHRNISEEKQDAIRKYLKWKKSQPSEPTEVKDNPSILYYIYHPLLPSCYHAV